MAEKSDKKERDIFVEVVSILVVVFLFYLITARIEEVVNSFGFGSISSFFGSLDEYFLIHILPIIRIISLIVSSALLLGVIYVYRRLSTTLAEENKKYGVPVVSKIEEEKIINKKWEQVKDHIESKNPSDWRLAIIEADIMLGELLEAMSYHGETIGDKLKAIEKSDFNTLDSAWEAHKVRNKIAHDGSNFELTEREARRVISLYEQVFNEFKCI